MGYAWRSMSWRPKVSVCLLAYNRGNVLSKTIESLLVQTFSDFELIINDDASSDSTADVCGFFARKDPRVKYFRNTERLGMPGNLNAAIRRAGGEFVANLHDGDIYRPVLLQRWAEALDAQPDAAFVFNEYECQNRHGYTTIESNPFGPRLEPKELTLRMLFDLTSPVWGTVMARRACYEEMGLFNERYSWYSDVEMWMRLNLRYAVAYVKEPLMTLTPHEDDRPYAKLNWHHERILVAMHEEIIDRLFADDAVALAAALAKLRRVRDRRWLRHLAICVRHRRIALLREGLRILRHEDRPLLKAIGLLGCALV
jgi:glycosyltransferase involved in cell wall biosynthesis